jgi:tetratricopeptide (TPR) repeat protein
LGLPHGVILFLGVSVLGVAVFLVYWPAASVPFFFDDSAAIVDNPSIRQLWPLVGRDTSPGPLNPPKANPFRARPFVNLSLAVNYYFGGLDPFGYRIVHIVVHALSAMLLWGIVARTLRLDCFRGRFDGVAEPLSFAAALVWALHPVNTESVVYVTQRTELLMGLCYLATVYCSIRYWTTDRPKARATFLVLGTLACTSGMLSKEMIASAPVMVLLFERTFVTGSFRRALRRSWPLYVGLALSWLPVLAFSYSGVRTPGVNLELPVYQWWFTQAKVLFLYLKLAVWPWPLVIHYEIPYLKSFAEAWPWLLATGLLATGTLVLLWRRSPLGYVALWFFAVLSPTLLIPMLRETAAERRMYVPLAAIVPLLIVGGYAVLKQVWQAVVRRAVRETSRSEPIVLFSLATIGLAIGLGSLSGHRMAAYQDELSLWQDAIVHQPHNPVVQTNLGTQLAQAGRVQEAIVHLEEAVRLEPGFYQAHYNLARALEDSARPQDAIEHYRTTLRLRPGEAAAHHNLARLLGQAGRTAEAIEHYQRAIALQPDFCSAHTNLGILFLNAGRVQEAIESFEAALRQQQGLGTYTNLAMAYGLANRLCEAIPMAEKALKLARSQGETILAEQIEAALAYFRAQQHTT